MRKVYPTLLLLTFTMQCSGQAAADPQYEGSLGPASYNGGYVLDWDSPAYTRVLIYGPDTKLAYSDSLKGVGGRYDVWAIDSDGTAARANFSRGNEGPKIELLDQAGKPMQIIRTGSYLSQHMAFAPDHTLWTVGYESNYESRADDFNVFHHYARNGEEIDQGLPWRQIAGDYNAYTSLQLCLGGKRIFAANNRIGFMAFLQRGRGTWIELSPGGTLLGKYDLGAYRELTFQPVAMTTGGSVYARIIKEDRFSGWAVLDRSTGQWRKVKGYPKGTIIGSDGDNVIFSQHDGGWTVLHSISSASLKVEPLKEATALAALR